MAAVQAVEAKQNRGLSVIATWTLAAADTAVAFDVSMFRTVCVQVFRVSGATDSISIQGSNDGTNFVNLNSQTQAAGADKALTALTNSVDTLRESPRFIKPLKSGATDPINIILLGIPRN